MEQREIWQAKLDKAESSALFGADRSLLFARVACGENLNAAKIMSATNLTHDSSGGNKINRMR